MKQFLIAVVIIAAQAVIASSQSMAQRAVLFEGLGCTGEYIVVPQTYVADLAQYNFDNRALSVQVTGVWVLYTEKNYNTNLNSGVEYVFGVNQYCANLQTIGGLVSSVRFVGSPNDYSTDTLTLFQDFYFQGEEEYTYVDLPSLNLAGNHKSLVITGSSGFTVYDSPNYSGNAICLFPPQSNNYTPLFLSDVASADPTIPHGAIKSVKKGCWGKSAHVDAVSEFARQGGINPAVV